MAKLSRRGFLAGSSAVLGIAFTPYGATLAQAGALNIFSHKVHETVATGEQGGNVVQTWSDETGTPVAWTTFDTGPLRERLFREASLGSTTVDIGFLLNTHVTPGAAALLEPLDPYLASDPIEDMADIFPGLAKGMEVGGVTVGVPFRHSSSGMHYNEEILAERGFSKAPETIEEFAEMARACTFKRDNGTNVSGFVNAGMGYANVVDIARAWNGDFISLDYKCLADQDGMVNAVKLFRAFYEEGVLPRNFITLGPEDSATLMQQGRVVFCVQGMSRNRLFNDPKASQYPGKIKTIAVPAAQAMRSQFDVAPSKVEFWGMVIPKNSQRKAEAWSLIQHMLSKDSTVKAALNGNGPVRISTYANADFVAKIPYGDEERRVLEVARVPMPAFDEAARAEEIFKEEAEAAVLGFKPVEEAMGSVVERVTPLLPS